MSYICVYICVSMYVYLYIRIYRYMCMYMYAYTHLFGKKSLTNHRCIYLVSLYCLCRCSYTSFVLKAHVYIQYLLTSCSLKRVVLSENCLRVFVLSKLIETTHTPACSFLFKKQTVHFFSRIFAIQKVFTVGEVSKHLGHNINC